MESSVKNFKEAKKHSKILKKIHLERNNKVIIFAHYSLKSV